MGITRPFLHDLPSEWVGTRIVLRRWREEDTQPLFDAIMESQEYLRQWLRADAYQSVGDAIEFVRRQSGHWALHAEVGTAIFTREGGALLGSIRFHIHNLAVPSFEIGYWLRQSAEGHGYMSEAVRIVTSFLFDDLHAQRVEIRCDARNRRSGAVAARLGYPLEGTLRHDSLGTDGAIRDTLIYAMIPDDFARARETWV